MEQTWVPRSASCGLCLQCQQLPHSCDIIWTQEVASGVCSVKLCLMDTHLGTARSAACLQSLLTVAEAAIALRPGRNVKTVTTRSRGRMPAESKGTGHTAFRHAVMLKAILGLPQQPLALRMPALPKAPAINCQSPNRVATAVGLLARRSH